jgi:DNA-binding CsgD family transcriptional regulator
LLQTARVARFSQVVLEKVRGFLLEIHSASDVDVLREVIPRASARLISSDRANFNEFNFVDRGRFVVPAPVPAYWNSLRAVMLGHAEDHVLFRARPEHHRAQTFSDRRNDRRWTCSTLFNEYYLPVAVRYQLATHVAQEGALRFSLAFNRSSRDFTASDRALLELISPHVECAWRNARTLSRLRTQLLRAKENASEQRHVILVDRATFRITFLSSEAGRALRDAFGIESREGDALPDDLNRWLAKQFAAMESLSGLSSLPQHLRIQRSWGIADILLARICPDSAAIILNEQLASGPTSPPRLKLTCRETEILNWIAEGKRNGEIATILSMGERTVGKHVEHILEKLGVENRTAAARVAFESRNVPNA